MTEVKSRIEQLKSEGLRAARIRGHFMGHWLQHEKISAESTCTECGAMIFIRPRGREEIGGTAVALTCK